MKGTKKIISIDTEKNLISDTDGDRIDAIFSATDSIFIDTYNKEVTQEKKQELEEKLKKIEDPAEKLKFLALEKITYLQNISPHVIESSGTLTFRGKFIPGTPLFFDRHIQLEMEKTYISYPLVANKKSKIKGPVVLPDYVDFNDLFKDEVPKAVINQRYQQLIDEGIIDDQYNFIKPPKGNICVWYQVLKSQNLLKTILKKEDVIVTPLLNKKFPGLDLYIGAATEHHYRASQAFDRKFRTTLRLSF